MPRIFTRVLSSSFYFLSLLTIAYPLFYFLNIIIFTTFRGSIKLKSKIMGKGDIKTRRGKFFAGSFGKKRPKHKLIKIGKAAVPPGIKPEDKLPVKPAGSTDDIKEVKTKPQEKAVTQEKAAPQEKAAKIPRRKLQPRKRLQQEKNYRIKILTKKKAAKRRKKRIIFNFF